MDIYRVSGLLGSIVIPRGCQPYFSWYVFWILWTFRQLKVFSSFSRNTIPILSYEIKCNVEISSMNLGVGLLETLTKWPWISHLASLSHSFFIWKLEIIISREGYIKDLESIYPLYILNSASLIKSYLQRILNPVSIAFVVLVREINTPRFYFLLTPWSNSGRMAFLGGISLSLGYRLPPLCDSTVFDMSLHGHCGRRKQDDVIMPGPGWREHSFYCPVTWPQLNLIWLGNTEFLCV